MIPLLLKAEIDGCEDDLVCRASEVTQDISNALVKDGERGALLQGAGWNATLPGVRSSELIGDVLLVQPRQRTVRRLIRSQSRHNTLLVTERCDQLCVMCSQPPKKTHQDFFRHYKTAVTLAPQSARIAVSGGEPTLYRDELFDFLAFGLTLRPDLSFHVLTNAQHFTEGDVPFLRSEATRRVLWGVPLYADKPELHDEIVGKTGAYEQLMSGLAILCRAGARTELRTVVMQSNATGLPDLAQFVVRNVPFAAPWAIMQLENTGFARNRWNELFYDHSVNFDPLAEALEIARLNGIPAALYNFPLCTVPAAYRRFAPSTISDWKQRYEPVCDGCAVREWCTGFFEWHPSHASYSRLGFS